MAEYIDREVAKKALGDAHFKNYGNAIMVIMDIPTADVRQVVLCKDCKHRQYDAIFGDSWCKGRRVDDSFFCGDGERME